MEKTEPLDLMMGMQVTIVTIKGEKIPAVVTMVSPRGKFARVRTEDSNTYTFNRRLTDMRYRSNRKIVGYLKGVNQ